VPEVDTDLAKPVPFGEAAALVVFRGELSNDLPTRQAAHAEAGRLAGS
jgi:hypothetical protein